MNIRFEKNNYLLFFVIGFLFVINWFLEIYKWKLLISNFEIISWKNACKQTLFSFLATPFTPAKLGEYGIKSLYFEAKEKVIIANFLNNFFQLLVTLCFGLVGLWYLTLLKTQLIKNTILVLSLFFIVFLIVYLTKKKQFLGFSFHDIYFKINFFSKKINQKVMILSILRYMVFLHQFYFFLIFFEVKIPYFLSICIIGSMYLLASFLPTFSFFDLAIKGSFALYLFGFFVQESEKIILITTSTWIFNTLFPLVIGLIWFSVNKFNFK